MLTPDDFEILLHAIDLWAEEPSDTNIKEAMVEVMLAKVSGKSEKHMVDLLEQAHKKSKAEIKLRTEQAILLKARLIQSRDKLIVADYLGDLADSS